MKMSRVAPLMAGVLTAFLCNSNVSAWTSNNKSFLSSPAAVQAGMVATIASLAVVPLAANAADGATHTSVMELPAVAAVVFASIAFSREGDLYVPFEKMELDTSEESIGTKAAMAFSAMATTMALQAQTSSVAETAVLPLVATSKRSWMKTSEDLVVMGSY